MATHDPTTSEEGLVTVEQLAAVPFAPWTDEGSPRFTAEQWRRIANIHMTTLRFAHEIMFKSKDELVSIVEQLDDATEAMVKSFGETAQ